MNKKNINICFLLGIIFILISSCNISQKDNLQIDTYITNDPIISQTISDREDEVDIIYSIVIKIINSSSEDKEYIGFLGKKLDSKLYELKNDSYMEIKDGVYDTIIIRSGDIRHFRAYLDHRIYLPNYPKFYSDISGGKTKDFMLGDYNDMISKYPKLTNDAIRDRIFFTFDNPYRKYEDRDVIYLKSKLKLPLNNTKHK
jgi:hypothetical protein